MVKRTGQVANVETKSNYKVQKSPKVSRSTKEVVTKSQKKGKAAPLVGKKRSGGRKELKSESEDEEDEVSDSDSKGDTDESASDSKSESSSCSESDKGSSESEDQDSSDSDESKSSGASDVNDSQDEDVSDSSEGEDQEDDGESASGYDSESDGSDDSGDEVDSEKDDADSSDSDEDDESNSEDEECYDSEDESEDSEPEVVKKPSKKGKDNESKVVDKKEGHSKPEGGNTVFVGNLPYNSTRESVHEHFESHGCKGIKKIEMLTDKNTGKFRGMAHLEVVDSTHVETAFSVDGSSLNGRVVRVSELNYSKDGGKNRSRSSPSPVIYVANIPFSTTEDELSDLFKKYGVVTSVRIPRKDGKPSGFGYVHFKDQSSADKAINQKLSMGGRPLRLDYENGNGGGNKYNNKLRH